jgi:hypothetical protein
MGVEELDINKIAVEFVQSNINQAMAVVSRQAKNAKNLIRSKLESTYNAYLTRILDRYSKGKSFFVRSEPIPLYEYFVPLDLATEFRVLSRPSAPDIAAISPFFILTGSGGSGKTMMMRHLLISTITSCSKTPIFLELRHLTQRKESITEALLRTLQTNGLDIDQEYFDLALEAGHFSLMFDGFDELEHSARKGVAKEIQELAERTPLNWIVVSSRSDAELEQWETFTRFQVRPLDLDSAVELVTKLPFDDAVKDRFIVDLKNGLFDKHSSFLSNPLLLSIMLLTYSDVAHIPNKLSVFYNQAYESLFQKHDALKGGFQRERKSGLDIQDFAKAFASFCVQSYDKREFTFPRLRALEILDRGKAVSQLDYNSEAVLDDALQSVCLLVEEGMDVTFAHRSFQEYFVARFVDSSPPEVKAKLIKRFSPNLQSDAVLALLHEIDPYSVERYYILPAIESLKKRIRLTRDIGITHYLRFVKISYAQFETTEHAENETRTLVATISDSNLFMAMRFIHQRYCTWEPDNMFDSEEHKKLGAFVDKELGGRIHTRDLTAQNELTRRLYSARGSWGAAYLRQVIEAEAVIRERHQTVQDSLDTILG